MGNREVVDQIAVAGVVVRIVRSIQRPWQTGAVQDQRTSSIDMRVYRFYAIVEAVDYLGPA